MWRMTWQALSVRPYLVGNSQQQLTDPTRGARIDAFDFVMRLNQAGSDAVS